jgi:hypothetical protein
MIPNVPIFIAVLFGIITLVALALFYKIIKNASDFKVQKKAAPITIGISVWLALQGILAYTDFYNTGLDQFPPKLFLLGFLPALLLIAYLFITKSGRAFIDSLPLKQLTNFNIIRLPIEIGLFLVYTYGAIPKLMTFEGGNLDILSGISAPIIAYLVFTKKSISTTGLLIWNFICLALLTNIVARALLSAPFTFQKFAFDQPNIAILNFPFIWLPTFMVMAVLFGHLASIRKLLAKRQ